jgi:hypothetical protein
MDRRPRRRRHNPAEQGGKDNRVADTQLHGNLGPLLHAWQHDLIWRARIRAEEIDL